VSPVSRRDTALVERLPFSGRARHLRGYADGCWDDAAEVLANDSGLTPAQLKIVQARWIDQGRRSDALWRNQRLAYYSFRVPIIVGAATVPVLASLQVPHLFTAMVGLVVAVLTGLDSFLHYGVRWQHQRRAATALTFEGWAFLELTGVYSGLEKDKAYRLFLKRIEELNERLEMNYLDLFRESGPNPRSRLSET
jgi:hypothetical protein